MRRRERGQPTAAAPISQESPMSSVTAVVLAAGKGTRMKSALPKVMHTLAGRPMIHWVVRAVLEAGAERVVVVVGHGRDKVEAYLKGAFGERVETVVQEEQRGTGHAAQVALPAVSRGLDEDSVVLVTAGDTPCLRGADLRALVDAMGDPTRAMAMLVATLPDATGYGRILRRDADVVGVKEHVDCSAEERAIREFNPAVYAFRLGYLQKNLPGLQPNNAQGELYLTDLVARANGAVADRPVDPATVEGINDRAQLSALEARILHGLARRHQLAGVTVRDPRAVEIHDGVEIGEDTVIERGVVLRGATRVGRGCTIDVGCVLTNVVVEDGVTMKPYSVATDSRVGPKAQIGPFTHLRPASDIGESAHVGNFVEVKKTSLGRGSKANHLAYLGDGVVGEDVNVGAGTIFCNYDGFKKHVTTLDDGSFIGSDTQLIAPVRVGKGAYVATGTTITRDVPDGALAIGRTAQQNKEGYADRLRARLKSQKK
ncbi:MAG: bifunctional UDP-N-acetylglucosamine diphosphorylase/glucosamine-1-phosphate N-acetyltransferase GlmU [Deltaproteobacteria bacterium]|nr:bifunctional UDP-N-acetylglucosamine diphosphorylase/glucosamine-1-phosphate N-acetyltransferase GlmU [Deltaproteobacteria bacterium]